MTDGTLVATIDAGGAVDTAGNGNAAWTSDDNSVVYDITRPTSTITFPTATDYNTASFNAGCSTPAGDICGSAADTGGAGLDKVEISIQQGSGNYWDGTSFGRDRESVV